MSKPKILHIITPADNVSPFDINMAADAGYGIIIPHCGVKVSEVSDFVQDAIFSRPPKSASSTAMFIGGYDVNQASDMLDAAKKAILPPFEISVFADPNGAFTTAAALVAVIEKNLAIQDSPGLDGCGLRILGGGPVGICTAVLAAKQGAAVRLVRLTSGADDSAAAEFAGRYELEIETRRAVSQSDRTDEVADAQVIVSTAKAGIQVLNRDALNKASGLLVAADVNAVPPTGIEGVEVMHNGDRISTEWGSFKSIGALGVGRTKYQTQMAMLKSMLESEDALALGLPDAYADAIQHT